MEFCKKCGSIMVPVKKKDSAYLACRKCGYDTKKKVANLKITEAGKKETKVYVLEKDTSNLPTTSKMCPKCEHMKAWWWLQQTRAADEPPTQFFRCCNCSHVWREYK